ncbi:MAG: hypothetical protein IIB87_02180 [Chloroflexi bacterium]|nr:hypothetical protein [Chloroflexota bacterium]
MNRRGLLITIMALLVLAAGAGTMGVAQAQSGGFDYAVHVDSLVMDVGEEGSVELSITDIADRVTAWTIEITYDAEVISVVDCLPRKGGVCREDLGVGRLQVTGASAAGLTRDTVLGSITVQCEKVGNSPLALSVVAYRSRPNMPKQAAQIEDGAVTCAEAAEPTSTPMIALPAAGGGGAVVGSGSPVASGLLALVGAALVCAGAASRVIRRPS